MTIDATRRRPCLAAVRRDRLRWPSRPLADAATLDRLRAFVRETQTARAQFTQTVVDRNGRAMKSANGTFELSRPGQVPLERREALQAAAGR